jgi:DNA-3-methyladenine glycosylase
LCWRKGDHTLSRTITETEAYVGPDDLASHAAKGRTKRNEPMFGPPGIFYVYFVYGMHWMLNVVTGPVGYPAAVLIGGVKVIIGPGRLRKALRIMAT